MKRIVVCCDGTWNSTDDNSKDTNVALLARAIHATQGTDLMQIVLYVRGVGTAGLAIEKLFEGAVGFGVDDNIRSAYMFIAQNYVPGDDIFIFGFSRGAFTARSLVGFIGACGILYRQSLGSLPEAWEYYRGLPPHSPAAFMEKYTSKAHSDVTIKFLGVWDTVGALGIPGHLLATANEKRFAFHDTSASPIVKHACHALAIDEHRDTFFPTLWTGKQPEGSKIEQVWFAGAHADVGGGYITRKLADIPLVWMATKAEASGLALDWSCLPNAAVLDSKAPTHDSSEGLFAISRFRPMLRVVADKQFPVSPFETLYAPHDENGALLPTINQAVHRSAIERFGQMVAACSEDASGACRVEKYEPRNLAAFWDAQKGALSGVAVAD